MAAASEDSWEAYQEDVRDACKYGEKCYQKNPHHIKRFKHPPKRKRVEDEQETEITPSKKLKADTEEPVNENPAAVNETDLDAEVLANKDTTSSELGGHKEPGYRITGTPQDYLVQDSPDDPRYNIEQKFLLEMPDDFFDFWQFCSQINKEKPEEALQKAGLTLVGPYDVLTGKLKNLKVRKVSNYVCHWRYYYDPPEFMTVIAGEVKEYHMGYYRDDPFQMPGFVASMSAVRPGNIKPMGENIFAAVYFFLTEKLKVENAFKKAPLQRLQKEIESYAKKKNYSLDVVTASMKARNKMVVAKTFHGAGIVVPVHNDVGYREIPETYANLKRMLQKIVDAKNEGEKNRFMEDIQELLNNVQFAYDEGDFGMGLEFGLNLFTYGGEVFQKIIFHILSVGYDLLQRDPYVDILHAHLQNRRRGKNMSILEVVK